MIRLAILKEFTLPSEAECKCGRVQQRKRRVVLEVSQETFRTELQAMVGMNLKDHYTRENILEAVDAGFEGIVKKYENETMFIK